MIDRPYISQGIDYYKATMGQVEYDKHPDAIVTFELKNRSDHKLSDYVSADELTKALAERQAGWQASEVAYLASLQNQDGQARFSESYLDYLVDHELPPVRIDYDHNGELSVHTTGPWPLVTFWETVVMSQINEFYFANKLQEQGDSLANIYREGDRRLSQKIERLKARPDIKISDFGTRRRFSYPWHHHVVQRLATELPNNFVGTSNIYLAHEFDLAPIGTFAHEMPMVYAALAGKDDGNMLRGHNQMLQDWEQVHRGDLTTALTDTFTTEFFFEDFTKEQAAHWKGLRHDSGGPIEFAERAIRFYQSHGIDPHSKTIVFSDGLDIDQIIYLADYFKGTIMTMFGWGTTLTNDLGIKANNFVMKAVEVDGITTVKLSDAEGKHTGTPAMISEYKRQVGEQIIKSHRQHDALEPIC